MEENQVADARVIALLSQNYLASNDCVDTFHTVLDPATGILKSRLIPIRIAQCDPDELLTAMAYVDLAALRANNDEDILKKIILSAVQVNTMQQLPSSLKNFWHEAKTVLQAQVRAVPEFMGRDQELKDIARYLLEKKQVVITNAAQNRELDGIGKSTLAQQYAFKTLHEYAGVWWLDARSNSSIIRGLIELGRLILPSLQKEPDRRKAAKTILNYISKDNFSRPWLLIYDNVKKRDVLEVFVPNAETHLLVISRNELKNSMPVLFLDRFSRADAVACLAALSGGKIQSKREVQAEKLAETLRDLPLSLSLAAAYCRHACIEFDTYHQRLIDQDVGLSNETGISKTIQMVYSLSFGRAVALEPETEKIMGLFAFLASTSIPHNLLSDKIMDKETRNKALLLMQELSLLDILEHGNEPTMITVHPLVQRSMRNWLKQKGEEEKLAAAALVLIAYALPLGEKQVETAHWQIFENLLCHARAVLENVPHIDDMAVQTAFLLCRLSQYLLTRADYVAAEPLIRWALEITEASYGPEHPAVTVHLDNLAMLLKNTNRFDEASSVYRRIMIINEQCFGEEHPEVLTDLNNLTEMLLLETTHRLSEVEPLAARVVETLEQFEKKTSQEHPKYGLARNNLAAIRAQLVEQADAEFVRRSTSASQNTGLARLEDQQEKWFWVHDGNQQGPLSQKELRQLISDGKIGPDDLLRRQTVPQWFRFDQLILHSHNLLRALR
jgi:hypothetical protein